MQRSRPNHQTSRGNTAIRPNTSTSNKYRHTVSTISRPVGTTTVSASRNVSHVKSLSSSFNTSLSSSTTSRTMKKSSIQSTLRQLSTTATPSLTDVALTSPHARSYRKFLPKETSLDLINKAYLDARWGPSAFNCSPLRFAVLSNKESKEKFVPALAEGNIPAQLASPFTLIFAYDLDFVSKMDKLSPNYDGGKKYYLSDPESIPQAAQLNAHLQAGYFLLSLRANGLDIGPATGFDPQKTNEIFFGPDTPYKNWKAFMYVNVGYGDESGLFPRDPRLDIEDVSVVF